MAARQCRCLWQIFHSSAKTTRYCQPVGAFCVPKANATGLQRYSTAVAPTWITETEECNEKVLAAVSAKVAQFKAAQKADSDATVAEQIQRARTLKELAPLADAYHRYLNTRRALEDVIPHLSDPDPTLREMFEVEQQELRTQLDTSISALPQLLLSPSSTDPLPLMLSINAGVGGSEAALFAEEMARMYVRFGEKRGWKIEILSETEGPGGKGGGGLRETTIKMDPPPYSDNAHEVYGLLRWEKGVHRVQRVPLTETQGRVHTSTVTVVVMPIYPDAPEAPIVDPKDVKTEVMRSRGAGGQHVNKTESAVRLTHLPTGITVSMQDSRSQHQNRAWAWDVLRARLSERKHQEEIEAKRASRQSQVKSADRSDKVRTYNFPQDRMSDHRIGLNLTGLKEIMDGDGLDFVVNALRDDFNARRLESMLKDGEDIYE